MKLSYKQVVEIFLSTARTTDLAQSYGVSTFTIRAIKRGRSHGDITGQYAIFPVPKAQSNRHILSDDMVVAIYQFNGSPKRLKELYGVSKSVADNIKFGYTYSAVTADLGPPGELRLHSLTWDDVCAIRASTVSSSTVAALFNISVATVNNVRSGRTRKFK